MYIVTLQVIQYIANTVTLEYNAKQILENKHNEEVALKHISIKDNEVVHTIHSFMDFLKREYANYFKIIKYEDISTTFEDEDILKKKALKYILEYFENIDNANEIKDNLFDDGLGSMY